MQDYDSFNNGDDGRTYVASISTVLFFLGFITIFLGGILFMVVATIGSLDRWLPPSPPGKVVSALFLLVLAMLLGAGWLYLALMPIWVTLKKDGTLTLRSFVNTMIIRSDEITVIKDVPDDGDEKGYIEFHYEGGSVRTWSVGDRDVLIRRLRMHNPSIRLEGDL